MHQDTSFQNIGSMLNPYAGASLTFWLRRNKYERANEQACVEFNNFLHKIAAQEEARVPEIDEFTSKMNLLRQRSWSARLALSLNDRVEDQRSWYDTNSKKNAEKATVILSLLAQRKLSIGLHGAGMERQVATLSALRMPPSSPSG